MVSAFRVFVSSVFSSPSLSSLLSFLSRTATKKKKKNETENSYLSNFGSNTISTCNITPETGLLANCSTALSSGNANTPKQLVERDGEFSPLFPPLQPFSLADNPALNLLFFLSSYSHSKQNTKQASSGGLSRPPTPSPMQASPLPRETSPAPPSS